MGVGGYCLIKDPVLANWSMKSLFNVDGFLDFAIRAVNTNDTMPLHTLELIKEEFPELKDLNVTVLGVSYLEDLGDTRHSPTEILVKQLYENWANVKVDDPYVKYWAEMDTYDIGKDPYESSKNADVIVFAVGHKQYKDIDPEKLIKNSDKKPLIIDCSNFLTDEKIKKFLKLGCKVKGVGKGHIKYL